MDTIREYAQGNVERGQRKAALSVYSGNVEHGQHIRQLHLALTASGNIECGQHMAILRVGNIERRQRKAILSVDSAIQC